MSEEIWNEDYQFYTNKKIWFINKEYYQDGYYFTELIDEYYETELIKVTWVFRYFDNQENFDLNYHSKVLFQTKDNDREIEWYETKNL